MSRSSADAREAGAAESEATIAWEPDESYRQRSRMRRFMERHDIATYDELLARAVADPAWYWGAVAADLGLPFEPRVLRRRVFRRPQSLAEKERRFANLEGGFAPGRRAHAVRGKRVLLIDDVLTSGATADAAARALRAAGAKRVYVAVAAT